jgi:hypothetical protein
VRPERRVPCRSQFDSILYALISQTGDDAYDLNSGDEDSYRVFRDQRLSAVSMFADPDTSRGGSRLNPDAGRLKGAPKPPPPAGIPPTASSVSASVTMKREAGQPPPAIHYGSTVCQVVGSAGPRRSRLRGPSVVPAGRWGPGAEASLELATGVLLTS